MAFKMKGWNGYQKSPLKQAEHDAKTIYKECYIDKDGKKVCTMKPPDPKELFKTVPKKKPDTKKFKTNPK